MYDRFVVDFYLPDYNIVIEVQGDYWHGNPKIYGNDVNLKPLTEKQLKTKEKDNYKYNFLTDKQHIVYMIWETDIYEDVTECLKFLNI